MADRGTEFKKGDCEAVKNGVDVDVRGTTQGDGTVRASRIEVMKDKGDDDGDDNQGD